MHQAERWNKYRKLQPLLVGSRIMDPGLTGNAETTHGSRDCWVSSQAVNSLGSVSGAIFYCEEIIHPLAVESSRNSN